MIHTRYFTAKNWSAHNLRLIIDEMERVVKNSSDTTITYEFKNKAETIATFELTLESNLLIDGNYPYWNIIELTLERIARHQITLKESR